MATDQLGKGRGQEPGLLPDQGNRGHLTVCALIGVGSGSEEGLWSLPWKHGSPSSQGVRQGGVEADAFLGRPRCCTQQGPSKCGYRVQGEIPTFQIASTLAPGLAIHCCLPVVGRGPGDPEKLGAVAWEPAPEIPVGSRSAHHPNPRQLPGATWKTREGGWWHPFPRLLSGQQDIPHP